MPPGNPLQTLTFLFTDIEGSTPMWDLRPADMAAATDRHNALLRAALERHGGDAFRVVGDSFCVAFPDALSAVAAAQEAQHALQDERWKGAALRVRMGLHSGAVERADEEVFRGATLARAARVMAAAHGGQVLLTGATFALLDGRPPAGCTLMDLGDHTLRGFARAERLYQLVIDGLPSQFPPVATQEALRTNLPASVTSFVGRGGALERIRSLLGSARMVTLIGSGGTGKTRLAIEAARDVGGAFPHGVWLVELAPLADRARVAHAVAATLGARAEGDTPPLVLIEAALRDKRALIVLDNCEHVVDEAAGIAQSLLRALPQLHILATSREALGIEGETMYRVPSLTMPAATRPVSAQDVAASEAGQLFVERARSVDPAFDLDDRNADAVDQVCRRLDGIPLAIELAAVRLTALSVDELARRLVDRFRLLGGGRRAALPRQRTLRALVDWSYELLSADEQTALARLAVFSGGFDLAAAQQVCSNDAGRDDGMLAIVEHLVAKSLVIADQERETQTRYRLLETIRQYASEKLVEAAEADVIRARHFAHFADLAERAAAGLDGPLALEWLDRLELEHDNLRAALDWSADAAPGDHARLAGVMRRFWDVRGHFTEGWSRLEAAVAHHEPRDSARLAALLGAGTLAYRLDHTQRSDDLLTEAIGLARELAARQDEAEALVTLAFDRSWQGGDEIERLALQGRALAQASGARVLEARALLMLGRAAFVRGELARARALFLDSARTCETAQCVLDQPLALEFAGQCALEQLDFSTARDLLERALAQQHRFGNVHDSANSQSLLGHVALNEGHVDAALAQCGQSVEVFASLHDPNCRAHAALRHAAALRVGGDPAASRRVAESAVATYRILRFPHALARALCAVAEAAAALGDDDAARRAVVEALVAQRGANRDTPLPALLEWVAGRYPQATVAPRLLGSAAALRERWSVPVFAYDRAELDGRHAVVRAQHGAFDHEFAAGRRLSRDEAIACALALGA